jgi:hypothetical protein
MLGRMRHGMSPLGSLRSCLMCSSVSLAMRMPPIALRATLALATVAAVSCTLDTEGVGAVGGLDASVEGSAGTDRPPTTIGARYLGGSGGRYSR